MIVLFIRALILYALIFVVIRITGKRQISQLQPSDLIMTLLISDLASEPAANTGIPLMYGIVPIIALFLVQQLISFISLKNERVRTLLCGSPLIVIQKGEIVEKALRSARYTITDLLEQLRTKDVFEPGTVEYAILETNGNLSVLLKADKLPATCADLDISVFRSGKPYLLVQDGTVHVSALHESGHEEKWLAQKLKACGAKNERAVFVAFLNSDGSLDVQLKEEYGGAMFSLEPENKA